jgi:hypothetical protein
MSTRIRNCIDAVLALIASLVAIALLIGLITILVGSAVSWWQGKEKKDDEIRRLVERASRRSITVDPAEDVGGEKDVGDAKPDFTLTAKEFGGEYKKDKKSFETKYKGKVVELKGVVRKVGRDPFGSTEARLYLEEAFDIVCSTADKNPWRRALPGQKIRLKGRVPKWKIANRGVLFGCVISDVSGPPPPTLTADELGKQYGTDRAGTSGKYNGKFIILTGETAKVEKGGILSTAVVFKTMGKPQVSALFFGFAHKADALKSGDKIKVLGEYGRNTSPDEVKLDDCILVNEGN